MPPHASKLKPLRSEKPAEIPTDLQRRIEQSKRKKLKITAESINSTGLSALKQSRSSNNGRGTTVLITNAEKGVINLDPLLTVKNREATQICKPSKLVKSGAAGICSGSSDMEEMRQFLQSGSNHVPDKLFDTEITDDSRQAHQESSFYHLKKRNGSNVGLSELD